MAEGRRDCPPCRGTGTIVSSAGGDPKPVTCPWCGGTGMVAVATPQPD